MESDTSDEMLMTAYLHGDRVAFDALYGRLAPRVHGFFLRAFGSRAVAGRGTRAGWWGAMA